MTSLEPTESSSLLNTPQDLRGYTPVVQEYNNVSPVISESPTSITVRRPVQYYAINNDVDEGSGHDEQTRATVHRYKYYSKLAPHSGSSLLMPNHVVPPSFYMFIPVQTESGKQSSIITIFSIWNTMMGTSLLSMPWAIQQSGFATGVTIILIMVGLTLYTAYRVMTSISKINALGENAMEFTDVCHYYLGRGGQFVSIIFSLFALLGAAIVYWVLMSNFLYHTVNFIYEKANNELNTTGFIVIGNISYSDAYCPHPEWTPIPSTPSPLTTSQPFWEVGDISTPSSNPSSEEDLFHIVWDQYLTTPFFLIVLLAPLINFKSPTFFTKFNALGTVSVVYIISFVIYKATKWGIHIEVESNHPMREFNWAFPALTGSLSLALFIHNCVISIVRNQKHPEHNARDLSIAYFCVGGTYLLIGAVFYLSFPLPKTCIEDNMLNNFRSSDVLTFVARIFLFFQMLTVFPLLMYIIRVQFMHMFFGDVYPSLKHVVAMNATVMCLCILFAVFLPQIGMIIRFSGALCGLAYIFALPCLVYMLSRKAEGNLTWPIIITHSVLISLGVMNFIAQFLLL